MAYFEWDDDYSVGVASLDAQHKELIKLINRLNDIERRGGDLTGVLHRLDWYVRRHFSFEEALMQGAGYERLKEHVLEHREFEKWLRKGRFAVRASASEAGDIGKIVNDYLKDWLKRHILVVDMDYKPILALAAKRGASLKILSGELIRTIEEARDNPTTDAWANALSLARDIAFCAGIGAGDPPGEDEERGQA